MAKQWSRRRFMQGIGLSASAALLANAGLPAVLAQDNKFGAFQQSSDGMLLSPDVELLCGDVTGFQLQSDLWEGDFGSVTFQMHEAWYNGESVYYIRTDASDQAFAAENKLVWVPLLNAAMAAEGSTSRLYTFENGADEQFPVVSHVPTDEAYSPAWRVHRVTFNGTATTLNSEAAIQEAESAGDVTVEALTLVVNFPLVKWPGGELAEDTEKLTYLGTGPLITPVNTGAMSVTFKLHECYPGSRYIITDTSAAPMAPMMAIAASPPTGLLVDAGATDEIWVFGNGIAGSGVMGFQPAIFDNAAGNPVWSPFWNHFTAVWTNEADAIVVTSSTQLRELVDAGALEIFNGTPNTDPTGFVVNCPVPIKAANTFQADMM
ncbi:MAG: hypothetical protein Q9P01_15225 [Anaerolineae bacterium]|nr:hypothetical protein [Anaerolineae bacterium]MDQ7036129.1 hypothetical protein [Anaerolineae bacterium]